MTSLNLQAHYTEVQDLMKKALSSTYAAAQDCEEELRDATGAVIFIMAHWGIIRRSSDLVKISIGNKVIEVLLSALAEVVENYSRDAFLHAVNDNGLRLLAVMEKASQDPKTELQILVRLAERMGQK